MTRRPLIFNYYKYVPEEHDQYFEKHNYSTGFSMQCLICEKPVKASVKVNSNWISHLRSCHPGAFFEFKQMRLNDSTNQSQIQQFYQTNSLVSANAASNANEEDHIEVKELSSSPFIQGKKKS